MAKPSSRCRVSFRFESLEGRELLSSYFVSPTGSDSAAGTSAAPWKTLQKAADSVQAGDLVTVRAGNYAGFIMGWDFHQNGTAANPITFKADPGAVINSKNAFTADGIDIESNNYIIIDGFKIDDTSGSITRAGIRAVGNSNVTIRNNFIEGGHHANWGIFTGFSINLLIENNTAINSGGQHGIYVSNSDNPNDNDIVRGNICYGNAQNGIQFNGDLTSGGDGELTGCIIENNIVHDNGWKGLSLISFSNGIVRNNLIYNNHTNGSGAAGIHLVAQPDTGMPSSNNLIENNTIIEPGMAAVRITDGSGNVFFNNLMVNPSSQYIVDESGSGNSIDSASNLGRTSTSGLFVSSSDYHLSSSSTAVNAGKATYSSKKRPTTDLEGNARPVGGSYDVGAYEFGSGSVDTTPPTVSSANYLYQTSPTKLTFTFSENVSATLSAGDLIVKTNPGGTSVAVTGYSYNTTTNSATFTLATGLADGNYRATFRAGSFADAAANALAADYNYDFFVMAGDVNHDRAVDISDLNVLGVNWLKTGMNFSQGDFNYDGTVNQADLNILVMNWQKTLSTPLNALPATDLFSNSAVTVATVSAATKRRAVRAIRLA